MLKPLKWLEPLFKTSIITLLLLSLSIGLSGAWWNFWGGSQEDKQPKRESVLAQGEAITDPTALLRYALPFENYPARKLQDSMEDIGFQLRGKRWGPINRDLKNANRMLTNKTEELLAGVPEQNREEAKALIPEIKKNINELREVVDQRNLEEIWRVRRDILEQLDDLEALFVEEFPFSIPEEYADLPRLKGRATVEVETSEGNLTVVVDGYSAPITAGNFVDLVDRGFYDGLEVNRVNDFAVQTGDPPGPEQGFINPETGEYRSIPLEILVQGDEKPVYGATLEEIGRYKAQPVLPFSANGAVAIARPSGDPNGGSSQFFFFKFDSELTPPGFNFMDGRYAIFGYAVQGDEILEDMQEGDKIISARVVKGIENLERPQASPRTANRDNETRS
ncbi:peptidylprolyl isomerase [Dactylococcopsis salina]|uniref:peptidylprolyl isomerase n=1 Tax=Dactylococcopsis salina (strain PCC 8305) TaxID=13035 RepID=K9YW16_DACS8|nr:peptidylprolyl isomerase [Dactylococcopsis salina]AFZ51126.1 peptidyl-prolyl cis-trans isomerase (rotamase) - cyclophilin family [Dactylococcopsis salina PCC 8305]